MLEFAYGAILTIPKIAIKQTKDINTYHLLFNYGEDGRLDVVYLYDKNYSFEGIIIDALPKNRAVIISKTIEGYVLISNNFDLTEPLLVFSATNPFDCMVLGK